MRKFYVPMRKKIGRNFKSLSLRKKNGGKLISLRGRKGVKLIPARKEMAGNRFHCERMAGEYFDVKKD